MNPGRVVDIFSFNLANDFKIAGSDVVVKAGSNTILRDGNTYEIQTGGKPYGQFSIDLGHLLFSHLRGGQEYEVSDER